jgi:predicted CoA-binding protein
MKSENKYTLVIGGSPKPERFSNKAIRKLLTYGHKVSSIGLRETEVEGVKIDTGFPVYNKLHTITMYLGATRQNTYYDYVLGLKPKRVIFNPGTENNEFAQLLSDKGIDVIEHCSLVMLDSGQF